MKEQIIYELNIHIRHFRGIMWTNILVNLSALIFFSLVGRFEQSESNSILTDSAGIMTLASTLTVSVAVIYNVVILNRLLLKEYIGNAREITFLFPGGRFEIFLSKIISLSIHCLLSLVPVLLFENLIFYFVGHSLGFLSTGLFVYVLKVICVTIFAGFLVLIVVLSSILVGQITQSINVPIIVAIIIVSIMGNFVAYLYQLNNLIIVLLTIGVAVLVCFTISILSSRVKKDDLIENTSIKNGN
ncbi:TPA: accessory regulator AgrC [Streptococcus suis]|uniref:accessory regulator AgrC n=1 Tax=Streptococcus suis TaxID=1307 RepID=UPI003708CF15